MKTIKLPCYGIVIKLGLPDPSNTVAFKGGTIESDLESSIVIMDEDDAAFSASMHAIESVILAHAVAGVDVTTPAYIEGIETCVQACENNMR